MIWQYIGGALVTGAVTIIVLLLNRLFAKRDQKADKSDSIMQSIEALTAKVDNIERHTGANYLSILRLTVMDDAMPMSERLIAGDAYIAAGGNGDVKHFYNELKNRIDRKEDANAPL